MFSILPPSRFESVNVIWYTFETCVRLLCSDVVKCQSSIFPLFAGLLAMQVLAVWQEVLSFSHLYRQRIVTDDESVCHCFWYFRQRKKTFLNVCSFDVLYKCILCVKSRNVFWTFKLYSIVYSKMYSIALREYVSDL
jgi:hypothetical protein